MGQPDQNLVLAGEMLIHRVLGAMSSPVTNQSLWAWPAILRRIIQLIHTLLPDSCAQFLVFVLLHNCVCLYIRFLFPTLVLLDLVQIRQVGL